MSDLPLPPLPEPFNGAHNLFSAEQMDERCRTYGLMVQEAERAACVRFCEENPFTDGADIGQYLRANRHTTNPFEETP